MTPRTIPPTTGDSVTSLQGVRATPVSGFTPAQLGEIFRQIVARSSEATAIIDLQGHYLEQNEAHRRLIGYADDELHEKTPAIHLGETTFAEIAAALRESGSYKGEVVSRTRDGREQLIELTAFTVYDDAGEPIGFVGCKRDLTLERQAQRELEQRYSQLQLLYHITDVVSRAEALDEIYEQALGGLQQSLGAPRSSILLYDTEQVMRFKAWNGLSSEYRAAVEGHSPWAPDDPDPRCVTIADVASEPGLDELRATVLGEGIRALGFVPLISRGRLIGKFMIYFDEPHDWNTEELQLAQAIAGTVAFAITRRNAEETRRQLADAAVAANKAKSDFLAVISHELRTPLNGILGYTELLLMGVPSQISEAAGRQVERIRVSARHLVQIIEEILTFSSIEAGRAQVLAERFDAVELARGSAELVAPLARDKGLAFQLLIPPGPVFMESDAGKARQILLNLLSNAIKFSPTGSVELEVEAGENVVRFHVRDTGIGIEAAHVDRIFEPFWQADNSHTRRSMGTGLGLSVTRQLAALLGGSVSLQSEVGVGSTFIVELPRTLIPSVRSR